MARIDSVAFALICGVAFAVTSSPAQAGAYKVLYSSRGAATGLIPCQSIKCRRHAIRDDYNGGGSTNCSGGCGTVFSLNLRRVPKR